MEVVAAASSIAGLASLAGQSLAGLSTLYNFFDNCRHASRTIDRFLTTISNLNQTLRDVTALVSNIKRSEQPIGDIHASLTAQLHGCNNDVETWLEIAKRNNIFTGSRSKRYFKKFVIAVKNDTFKDVHEQMATHRHCIALSLSVLGRYAVLCSLLHSSTFSAAHPRSAFDQASTF